MKIMEWNVHGASGHGNYFLPKFVADCIVENSVDVAVLTEFYAGCNWESFRTKIENDYKLYISPYKSDTNQCLIAVKKQNEIVVDDIRILSNVDIENAPNFLQLNIKYFGKELIIIGVRIKECKNRKEWRIIDNHLAEIEANHVICIGDFNAYWSDGAGVLWKKGSNFTLPKTSNSYELETPQWNQKNGFSFVHKNMKRTGIDSFIYKGVSITKPFKYDWNFVKKENGYGNLSKYDYKSNIIGLPDHAILIGEFKVG